MEPHWLTKLIHVTKLDEPLQWHGVKNQRIWHWNVPQIEIFPIRLNRIEYFFHLVKKKTEYIRDELEQNITQEKYYLFSDHVKETMFNFSVANIENNNIIEAMDVRMNMIMKKKGQRQRYRLYLSVSVYKAQTF